MKTRWAVALAPNEPLVIDTVDLDGPDPRGGDVRARLQRLDVIL
jgi:Zn-dependent alcohol dehydrogenase